MKRTASPFHGAQVMSMSIKYNHNKIIKKHKYNCSKKSAHKCHTVTWRMCLQSKRDNSKL